MTDNLTCTHLPDRSPDLWIIACLTTFPSSTQYASSTKKQINIAETILSFSTVWLSWSVEQWLFGKPLPTYSGRTAQDLHLVPYFPAVPAETRHELNYLVYLFLTQFLLVVKKVFPMVYLR
jgi:hypothetical protein